MAQDVFEVFPWTVRSYECAPDGAVTVANLCNYLQESASLNAEHLGFSKIDYDAAGLNATWVMTRMRLAVTRRPKWGETVKLLTFPRPARRIVAWRDFVLSDTADAEIGRASTEWMMIDLASRRPVAIPAFVTERANTARGPVFAEPLGLRAPAESFAGAETRSVRAAPSDIDLNGHVNNVRYITWLFDAQGAQPSGACELELVFRGETRLGESGTVETVRQDGGTILQRLVSAAGAEQILSRTVLT